MSQTEYEQLSVEAASVVEQPSAWARVRRSEKNKGAGAARAAMALVDVFKAMGL